MTFNNIKTMKQKEGGFTIVELLIVIVIIGILAALVIVAYTGITNRANATKAKTNAQAIQKKAEAIYANNGSTYPITVAGATGFTGDVGSLPAGVSLLTGAGALSGSNGTTTVEYQFCDAGQGYQVWYWDYSATPAARTSAGTGGTQGTCAVPAS